MSVRSKLHPTKCTGLILDPRAEYPWWRSYRVAPTSFFQKWVRAFFEKGATVLAQVMVFVLHFFVHFGASPPQAGLLVRMRWLGWVMLRWLGWAGLGQVGLAWLHQHDI